MSPVVASRTSIAFSQGSPCAATTSVLDTARMFSRSAIAAVEVQLVARGVNASDRPRDDDLGAEPPCLFERTARQLVARHPAREAEVVLDPRGRACLAAGCLALDHDRPESLGRAVHGRRQAGRPRADDHRVVLRGRRLGRDLEKLGHAPKLRSHRGRARRRAPRGGRSSAGSAPDHCVRFGEHVRLEPPEADLVAVEEAPQLRTGGVPSSGRARSPEPARVRMRGPAGLWAPRAGSSPGDPPAPRPPARRRRARSSRPDRSGTLATAPLRGTRRRGASRTRSPSPRRAHRVSARRSRCRRRRRACAR